MNLVLTTFGTYGDVYPYVTLGLSLQKRGFQVTVISSENFKDVFVEAGLSFISCGSASEYLGVINNPELSHSISGVKLIAKYVMLDPMRELFQILSTFDPVNTVIISTPFAIGSRLANEKLHFPLINICLQPAAFWSLDRPPILSFFPLFTYLPKVIKKIFLVLGDKFILNPFFSSYLNEFRQSLGMHPIKNIYSNWLMSPQKSIGLFPEWFAHPASDWPKSTQLTGFIKSTRALSQPLSAELQTFINAGDPPVVFTFGTSMVHGDRFFHHSIESIVQSKRRGIVVTPFRNQLPPDLPQQILHVSYAPFDKLLPYASAIVHHGGIGTLSHALSARIPQLLVPMINDQADNAFWLGRINAGLSLTPKYYSAKNVNQKLNQLLVSDLIKTSCQYYGEKINFEQSIEETCDVIEGAIKNIPR